MLPTPRAILLQLEAVRSIPPILTAVIIPALALLAC
jgi:hypothetical protein